MYKTNSYIGLSRMMTKTKPSSKYQKFTNLNSCKANIEFHWLQSLRFKSHYTSLGLDLTASPKDIKAAYYELSLKFHPDKNRDCPESVTKFREIAEAYEVLGNPEKKRIYDSGLNYETNYRPHSTPNDFDPSSDNYYRSRTGPRTGRDRYYNYEEHFRRHYEEFHKTKEANEEEFRRRWQGNRRHRYGEENAWERYQKQSEEYKRFRMRQLLWNPTSAMLFGLFIWLMITVIFPDSFLNPDNLVDKKPIYYNAKKKEDKSTKTNE